MIHRGDHNRDRLGWEPNRPPLLTRDELQVVARFALPFALVVLLLANTTMVPVSFLLFTVQLPLALVIVWSGLLGLLLALRVQVIVKQVYGAKRGPEAETPPPHVVIRHREPGL